MSGYQETPEQAQSEAAPLTSGQGLTASDGGYGDVTNIPPALQGGLDQSQLNENSQANGTQGYGSSIDVGTGVEYNPNIPAGDYGSEVYPTTTSPYGSQFGQGTQLFGGTQQLTGSSAFQAGSMPAVGTTPGGIYGIPSPQEEGISAGLASDVTNWMKGLGQSVVQGFDALGAGLVGGMVSWVERFFLIIVGVTIIGIAILWLAGKEIFGGKNTTTVVPVPA